MDDIFSFRKRETAGKNNAPDSNSISIAAIKMLETLAGGIAHDYNNILTVILGNITLARSYPGLEAEVQDIFVDIEKAVIKAKELTEALIAFSKPADPEFSKGKMLDLVKQIMETTFCPQEIFLDLKTDDTLWDIEFDKKLIKTAFTCILQFIFSESNKKHHLEIQIFNHLKDNKKWQVITITDLNLVLLNDKISELFNPGFSVRKQNYGIALISAYAIVLKHKGYISVNSCAGKGTTFSIYLPAVE